MNKNTEKRTIAVGQMYDYHEFMLENNNSDCDKSIENVVNKRSDKSKDIKAKFEKIIAEGLYFEPQTEICESFNSRQRQSDIKMEIKNLIAKDNKTAIELEKLTNLKDFLKTYKKKEVKGNGLAKLFLSKKFTINYVGEKLSIFSNNEQWFLPFIGDCSNDFNFEFNGHGTLFSAIQKAKNKNFVSFQISENTLFLIDQKGNKLAGALGIPVLKRNFLKKKYYGTREILTNDNNNDDKIEQLKNLFGLKHE